MEADFNKLFYILVNMGFNKFCAEFNFAMAAQ